MSQRSATFRRHVIGCGASLLLASVMGAEEIRKLAQAGYPFDGDLITALPSRVTPNSAPRACAFVMSVSQSATISAPAARQALLDAARERFGQRHMPIRTELRIGRLVDGADDGLDERAERRQALRGGAQRRWRAIRPKRQEGA